MLRSGEIDLAIGFDSRIARRGRRHRPPPPARGPDVPRDAAPTTRSRASATCGSPTSPTTPWIGGTPDCECNRLINRACAVAGFEPRIAFETDDYTAMQGFVAAGVGVSLIAELGLTSIRDDIVVRASGATRRCAQIYAATAIDGTARPRRRRCSTSSRRRDPLRVATPAAPARRVARRCRDGAPFLQRRDVSSLRAPAAPGRA